MGILRILGSMFKVECSTFDVQSSMFKVQTLIVDGLRSFIQSILFILSFSFFSSTLNVER